MTALSTESIMRLIAQAVPDMARRAVATQIKRLGFVDQDQEEDVPFAWVLVDGDATAMNVLNMTGTRLRQGDRVVVDFYPPHGVVISGVTNERPWFTAWGIIASISLDTDYGPTALTGSSDLLLSDVAARADRSYRVHLKSNYLMSGAAVWSVELTVDAVSSGRFWTINEGYVLGDHGYGVVLWEPEEDGEYDLREHHIEVTGSETLTLVGSATEPRQLWVEDIGPRP